MLAAGAGNGEKGPGITLDPLSPAQDGDTLRYRHVELSIRREERRAELTIRGPEGAPPSTAEAIQAAGADQWSLRCFREIDDALLRLRFHYLDVGVVIVRTRGALDNVLAADQGLSDNRGQWLANEILRHQARVLRRLDISSRSLFSLVDEGSCFAGSLLEIALASDRVFMLEDDDGKVAVAVSPLNRDAFPMYTGTSRLQTRFIGEPELVGRVLERQGHIATTDADELGLVTVAADDIDWEDDVRIAIEERASMSPDALTGMEASLRFPGPETMESKIFARLSAWQNWIFQRPNAVGPQGALTKYGEPDRAVFDWTRC